MSIAIIIFEFVVLIFSAVLHEVAHGYIAEQLGDPTARNAGRLTLNPIKHLDPFGSVLLPILLYIGTGGAFIFASAKPVPYNPNNLRYPRSGGAKIAIAGPATNMALAIIFGLALRIAIYTPINDISLELLAIVCYINILLALFNLIPIPPLDGSRVLFAALPQTPTTQKIAYALERWGLALVILFVFFGFQLLVPVVNLLFSLFTGQSFGM
jgi:Zn-dependent protease